MLQQNVNSHWRLIVSFYLWWMWTLVWPSAHRQHAVTPSVNTHTHTTETLTASRSGAGVFVWDQINGFIVHLKAESGSPCGSGSHDTHVTCCIGAQMDVFLLVVEFLGRLLDLTSALEALDHSRTQIRGWSVSCRRFWPQTVYKDGRHDCSIAPWWLGPRPSRRFLSL